ncbi:MAG: site-2 protease family protein [Candidatus Thermoplasmatota archaeon]
MSEKKWSIFNNHDKNNSYLDLELLKQEVGKKFPFYDVRYNEKAAAFYCRIDEKNLESNFEELRILLSKKGYIPMLRHEKGEHLIYVTKKPETKARPVWINLVTLIATIFTTALAGAWQWIGIKEAVWANSAGILDLLTKSLTPTYMLDGFLYFTIPLLSILGIHEMGHYFISKKHNLNTSLPFFIPVPPPFILGTFGAVISTREPIPNRKALLDVGVSGPISGFLVAIPVSIIGLFFMQQNPFSIPSSIDTDAFITPVYPLLLQWLSDLFNITSQTDIFTHPTLFAGWVGFFLTAVNLLPVGQLDGGHVAKALLKDKQKYASWAVIIFIFIMVWLWPGWIWFAFIILFLIGTKHTPPLNELSPLGIKRIIVGIIALIIFALCFAPIPIQV